MGRLIIGFNTDTYEDFRTNPPKEGKRKGRETEEISKKKGRGQEDKRKGKGRGNRKRKRKMKEKED